MNTLHLARALDIARTAVFLVARQIHTSVRATTQGTAARRTALRFAFAADALLVAAAGLAAATAVGRIRIGVGADTIAPLVGRQAHTLVAEALRRAYARLVAPPTGVGETLRVVALTLRDGTVLRAAALQGNSVAALDTDLLAFALDTIWAAMFLRSRVVAARGAPAATQRRLAVIAGEGRRAVAIDTALPGWTVYAPGTAVIRIDPSVNALVSTHLFGGLAHTLTAGTGHAIGAAAVAALQLAVGEAPRDVAVGDALRGAGTASACTVDAQCFARTAGAAVAAVLLRGVRIETLVVAAGLTFGAAATT